MGDGGSFLLQHLGRRRLHVLGDCRGFGESMRANCTEVNEGRNGNTGEGGDASEQIYRRILSGFNCDEPSTYSR